MRIHKPIQGFNLDLIRLNESHLSQIKDEIKLLEYLTYNSDLGTQKVIKNRNGQSVTRLKDGTPVTVLEWIEGTTLENLSITNEIALNLGIMLGKLHKSVRLLHLDHRYQYNEVMISEMLNECAKAYENKHFNEEQTRIINSTLYYIRGYFLQHQDSLVIVHSDLGKSNMLFDNKKVIPIDLSLSGYSVPEMDLASVFSHINDELLNSEILKGYRLVIDNDINEEAIKICMCFQILLFVICQHNIVATKPWFSNKLNEWCEQQFIPLITNKEFSSDIGLYV
jgi:Ser/Thr protein kinase RdoA (MazF antagonist)